MRNTFVIFIVSGFWHGANWTFVIWGALNAIYFIPLLLTKKNRNHIDIVAKGKYFPTLKDLFLMFVTFGLTVFAWIFFRAEDLNHAFQIISSIFSKSIFSIPSFSNSTSAIPTILLIIAFVIVEWFGRETEFAIQNMQNLRNRILRWTIYIILVVIIFYAGSYEETAFIYFQF